MAMDKDFPTISDYKVHNLGDIKASLEGWIGQIFPIEVKERDPLVH
jgi:hypothetical protein